MGLRRRSYVSRLPVGAGETGVENARINYPHDDQ
jgi:hypothetical protein